MAPPFFVPRPSSLRPAPTAPSHRRRTCAPPRGSRAGGAKTRRYAPQPPWRRRPTNPGSKGRLWQTQGEGKKRRWHGGARPRDTTLFLPSAFLSGDSRKGLRNQELRLSPSAPQRRLPAPRSTQRHSEASGVFVTGAQRTPRRARRGAREKISRGLFGRRRTFAPPGNRQNGDDVPVLARNARIPLMSRRLRRDTVYATAVLPQRGACLRAAMGEAPPEVRSAPVLRPSSLVLLSRRCCLSLAAIGGNAPPRCGFAAVLCVAQRGACTARGAPFNPSFVSRPPT